ncbi:hypothetical protein HanIR_Chr14g0702651 [Helianthus annuus]|nr:hypothetical protein HanIR_Chr14g0702651 [Helianthus annuus]
MVFVLFEDKGHTLQSGEPAGVAQLATDTHLLPRGTGFEPWGEQSTLKGSARQGYLLPGSGLSGGGLGGVIPSAVRGTVHYPFFFFFTLQSGVNIMDEFCNLLFQIKWSVRCNFLSSTRGGKMGHLGNRSKWFWDKMSVLGHVEIQVVEGSTLKVLSLSHRFKVHRKRTPDISKAHFYTCFWLF